MMPRVAVVEDEEAISELLRYNLEAEGFEVDAILRATRPRPGCASGCRIC